MALQNEAKIDFLINRYQRSIFSLILNLIGGDKNAAYDIAVASFVQASQNCSLDATDAFFCKLAAAALEKCRAAEVVPVADATDFRELPVEKRKILQITRNALYSLPFETKALLLLRDQLRLPYRVISTILKVPEKNVRVAMNSARADLRKQIEEILTHAR
jgi:DNA-directed RNA polymerase specialized sigma24 family protein